MTERLGRRIQIVGDDLYVTIPSGWRGGSKEKASNSILIKLNQIGTLTENARCHRNGKRAGFTAVVSHRSARLRMRLSLTWW